MLGSGSPVLITAFLSLELFLMGCTFAPMGALLRHFRDLDLAEEAFQEACLRALKSWPKNGPPRDTIGWLVFAAVIGLSAGTGIVIFATEQLPAESSVDGVILMGGILFIILNAFISLFFGCGATSPY